MKMTRANRLNYNYYYLAFDVVHESNYKMLREKTEGSEDMRGRLGVFPSRVIKSNLCYWENRVSSRQYLMYDSK